MRQRPSSWLLVGLPAWCHLTAPRDQPLAGGFCSLAPHVPPVTSVNVGDKSRGGNLIRAECDQQPKNVIIMLDDRVSVQPPEQSQTVVPMW